MSGIDYVLPPAAIPSLPIAGDSRRFAVHRIFCVGRNYAEHAREMGHDPSREPPFFFMKPAGAIVIEGGDFVFPPLSADVHHEIELVVAIAIGGTNIDAASSLDHVFGYAAGLDMTRRDLQNAAKKLGRPWDVGKAFDHSAPCSELVPASRIGHPASGAIELRVNGEIRQSGDIGDLIWNVAETISCLSMFFTLQPGDLIFTGTPSGVGPVHRGDRLVGSVAGVAQVTTTVV